MPKKAVKVEPKAEVKTVESQVFEDKMKALKYARDEGAKFFRSTYAFLEGDGSSEEFVEKPIYVCACSKHQARLALVDYLMPLDKWDVHRQRSEYIAALEEAVNGDSDG